MIALTLTAPGGPDHLRVQQVPRPEIRSPDDVLVRIHAAALNRLDLFVSDGLPGMHYTYPHVMGADGAGVVEAVGAGVQRVRVGERVMINPGIYCGECDWCRAGEQPLCLSYRLLGEHLPGSIAEYVVVPERNITPVPPDMSWPQAAAFSLATLTAWRMVVNRAALKPRETVLIWGIGGGVALAALKIAKLIGARVIATSSSDQKLERARSLGADVVLNHSTVDVAKEVRGLTDRRGVNVVVDNVGEKTWEQSLRCLGRLGRLVTCGATSGPMVVTDVRKLFWYQWSILGSTMGNEAEYRTICGLADRGQLWPDVDVVVPLADAASALQRLRDGVQLGKVVIEVR